MTIKLSYHKLFSSYFFRILDVRDFIVQSRPEFATLDFILVTSFPNKVLTDESLTLQEADILNTVILQQLKWYCPTYAVACRNGSVPY